MDSQTMELLLTEYTTQLTAHIPHDTLEVLHSGLQWLPEWGGKAGFTAGPIFISYIALLHSTHVCQALFNRMHPDVSMLHTWVAMLVLSFGGTTMASILLARPPGWLVSNDALAVYTAVYLLFRFTPVLRVVNLFGVLAKVVLAAADGVARALAISAFAVDTIRFRSSGSLQTSIVACLLCGTLSGCGGGLINGIFGVTKRTWTLGTPVVSIDVQLAFLTAALYTALTFSSAVSLDTAKGVCCALDIAVLVLQVLVDEVNTWIACKPKKSKKTGAVPTLAVSPASPAVAAGKSSATPSPVPARKRNGKKY
ncbi:hypothetical protein H9P43_000378 [Blastocladiella emersonii ATCC 22665]|nr:hypothetical protein H9P43_000378 [Blastocladiella emersonii ATCC 22665]